MKATLIRESFSKYQTLGKLTVKDENEKEIFSCDTLELPWKENKNRISCIPEGSYKAIFRDFGNYANRSFHIQTLKGEEVPGRTSILIHSGNFFTDTKGCILVGKNYADIAYKSSKRTIQKDNILDLLNSRKTMDTLLDLGREFEIDILNKGEVINIIEKDIEIEEEILTPLRENEKAIVCVETKLNVRDIASTKSKVLGTLSNNDEVIVINLKGEWVLIRKEIEGWVSSNYIKDEKGVLYVNTKGGNLNIRTLPSTGGDKIVEKGIENKTKLIFLENKGNWTKVRIDYIEGYVYQDYLKK